MTNVKALPINTHINSNDDVVNFLRALADNIEDGNSGDVSTLLIVLEHDSKTTTLVTGAGGLDNARVMGLLAIAQHKHMQPL